jgi:hypothetical protein
MMAVPGALVKGSYASKAALRDGMPVNTAAVVNTRVRDFNEEFMVRLMILWNILVIIIPQRNKKRLSAEAIRQKW